MTINHTRPPKAAMLIARAIVDDALRAGLRAGDQLPPERSMLAQYATGRGTLREALRLLEMQGVILLKPGPGGGPVLQEPDASHLASTIVLLMELRAAPFRTIAEVRTALEPMISALAAERMSPDALQELAGTIDLMRANLHNEHLFLEANKRFHDVIARSSGNALFGYIVESLLGIMDGSVIGIDYPAPRRVAILKAHDEIHAAIAARDPASAEARMREHIEAYVGYLRRKFPDAMNQVIPWGRWG